MKDLAAGKTPKTGNHAARDRVCGRRSRRNRPDPLTNHSRPAVALTGIKRGPGSIADRDQISGICHAERPADDPGDLSLPGQGALAGKARSGPTRDRRDPGRRPAYAIENGPSGFDPGAPAHLPKTNFLMLMRNERLATLRSHFDDATHTLVIESEGREAARGDLSNADGRAAIEAFFATYCADELRGPPKRAASADFSFSDVAKKVVSIINLASVAAIETATGAAVIRCAFAATSMSKAGRPGMNSICWDGRSRSGRTRG